MEVMPTRTFVFGVPMMLLFVGAGVALAILALRGRARRRRPAVRAEYVPTVRPVREGSRWGTVAVAVVAVLAVAGAFVMTVRKQRYEAPATIATIDTEVFRAPAFHPPEPLAVEVRQERAPARANWMKKPKPPAPPQPAGIAWSGTIERGAVASLADSPDETLDAIRRGLAAQLGLNPIPEADFVANKAWVRFHEKDRKPLTGESPNGETVFHIDYAVEVTQQGWAELARQVRHERSGDRMQAAALGLGLVTVLLGAVAGYVRLDEWTKGYYTGRLFLAAVAVVVAAGAGVVLLVP